MQAETQQGVIQVVDARDGGEHPLHGVFAGLAGPGGHHLCRGLGILCQWTTVGSHHLTVLAPGFKLCQGESSGDQVVGSCEQLHGG